VELVPISCGNYGHIADGEVFVEYVEGSGEAASSCRNY
jgi:hypothetical protein